MAHTAGEAPPHLGVTAVGSIRELVPLAQAGFRFAAWEAGKSFVASWANRHPPRCSRRGLGGRRVTAGCAQSRLPRQLGAQCEDAVGWVLGGAWAIVTGHAPGTAK
jgi:hypothetical protein